MACCFTDIHLTFLFQPVPLYPLVSGYVMGLGAVFGATTHVCMCGIIFLLIYQIGSMIACFVKKHQAIAGISRKSVIPNILLLFMFIYFVIYTISVTGIYATLNVPEDEKFELKYPTYLEGFRSLPNFSIYDPSGYFVKFVIYSLVGGIAAFFTLVLVLLNISRMLRILKTKMSASTYQKHKSAIFCLLAQFSTSSVIFLPPIFFVFVILMGANGAQLIVEYLLVIACSHSTLNVVVLIITFPPYRKFVGTKFFGIKKTGSRFSLFTNKQSVCGVVSMG
ncbi:Protein CBG19555 [Caenorhabditis briggsae]|uniref:Protein CBG19555 n=1 Tax=Caenorhabditis briggsae TaxID=6238 RepID=A8XVW1_CAEBR|nr:Protein CBG19555 [Caenorhabditis briggsae]CAP36780.2 Protein CBG19555 [Caenorhabditis briggsae]